MFGYENGGRDLSATELALLALAVNTPIEALLEGDDSELIALGATIVPLARVRFLLTGGNPSTILTLEVADWVQTQPEKLKDLAGLRRRRSLLPDATPELQDDALRASFGLAEQRAAKRLGTDAAAVSYAAFGLWGMSLTAKRDSLAASASPPDAEPRTLAAVRGRVMRDLLGEVASRIEEVDRHNRKRTREYPDEAMAEDLADTIKEVSRKKAKARRPR
jgi:hypothetical protein